MNTRPISASFFTLWLFPVIAFFISGCGSSNLSWEEEAQQSDGSILLVERTAHYVRSGEIVQLGTAHGKEWSVRFKHPVTKRDIVFSDPGDQVIILMAINVLNGIPYLVARPTGTAYDFYGCPTPPYLIWKYTEGEWHRVSINELPDAIARPNLIGGLGYTLEDLIYSHNQHISMRTVQSYYVGSQMADYDKKIDRRIRNPLSVGCHKTETLYGAGAYLRMRDTGNWLDRSPQEIEKLLSGSMGSDSIDPQHLGTDHD